MRHDTCSKVDVGVNREVTLAIAFSPFTKQPRLMLTRYFTAEEIALKRQQAEKEGKSQTLVNPFANMAIPIEGAEIMLEKRMELQVMVSRMTTGDFVEEEEAMVRLSRKESDKLFVRFDTDSCSVHVRKYWRSNASAEWKPHKQGVTINPDEFTRVLLHLDELVAVAKANTP